MKNSVNILNYYLYYSLSNHYITKYISIPNEMYTAFSSTPPPQNLKMATNY